MNRNHPDNCLWQLSPLLIKEGNEYQIQKAKYQTAFYTLHLYFAVCIFPLLYKEGPFFPNGKNGGGCTIISYAPKTKSTNKSEIIYSRHFFGEKAAIPFTGVPLAIF